MGASTSRAQHKDAKATPSRSEASQKPTSITGCKRKDKASEKATPIQVDNPYKDLGFDMGRRRFKRNDSVQYFEVEEVKEKDKKQEDSE